MRIQHNVTAMNSYRNFNTNNSSLAKNLEKLSSGYKINRAGDDAAGLAISEKMRAQISGLEGATKNAKDGISLVQTAEGALTEVHDMLNRMYTLAEQSANGTYEDGVDRAQLQKEVDQLRTEIDRIADSANFNGIKLLNGDLGAVADPSVNFDKTGSVDFSEGIDLEATDGVGAQSQFELNLDTSFGVGDQVTLSFQIPNTTNGTYKSESITLTHQDAALASYDDANLTFSGRTKQEQLTSIMNRLQNSQATLSDGSTQWKTVLGTGNYTAEVSSSGDKLTFTGKTEAENGMAKLTSVVTNNVDAGVTGISATAPTAGTAATGAQGGVDGLLSGEMHYVAGDKLKFNFKLNGTDASAIVEITEDMVATDDVATITNNIAEKLKNANFEDNANTKGFDESQMKVSDFFTVSANVKADGTGGGAVAGKGSLNIITNDLGRVGANNSFTLTDVQLAQNGSSAFGSIHSAGSGTTVTAGTYTNTPALGSAGAKTINVNQNLAVGDKFVMKGKLSDGRTFDVELTAGTSTTNDPANNTFAVGDAKTNTTDNIMAVLRSSSAKVSVTNGDGSVVEVRASEIFGDGTNAGSTFTLSNDSDNLKLTNASGGAFGTKGLTGDITYAGITPSEAAISGDQTVDGVDATNGTLKLTFDAETIKYGTAVTLGTGSNKKTFELVDVDDALGNEAEVTQSGNIRVKVGDLANKSSEEIAEAFTDAINNELVTNYNAATNQATAGADTYTQFAAAVGMGTNNAQVTTPATANYATRSGNVITLTSAASGSGNAAKAAAGEKTYGESENVTIDYETNADGSLKLKQGDTIKINGSTYQFDTSSRNLQGDNKLIKVSDFSDKEEIAKAIKLAVEEEDDTISATVNDDNTVTLSGKYVDGKFATPTLEQTASKGGLTLQIGDTSEDFNKLTVNIRDMHTDSIGTYTAGDTEMKLIEGKSIKDIDIGSQEGAAEALDVIKNAINMVSDVRGTLGASQNRLEHTINNLGVMRENIQNAESAIRDTDVAEEMMAYTKNNILVQSAQAMLAQANQLPQGVLQLLG